MDEFELRPKLPYLLIIALFIYLAIFNSLFLNIISFQPIEITYSETDFWMENDAAINDLVEIAGYSGNPEIRFWDVYHLKENYLQEFQAKYPEQYRSTVNWLSNSSGKWLIYYKCSVLFFIFSICLIVYHLRNKQNRSAASFLRILALLIFAVSTVAFTRYEAEKYIEKELKAELVFITNQLPFDEQAQKNRLQEEQINEIKRRFCDQLAQDRAPRLFWWARTLEKYSIGNREFPSLPRQYSYKYDCDGR